MVVAAHRQDRPWQGERATVSGARPPEYVESCYFCPRNVRVGGARNPDYQSVFVFDNDHPCVGADAPRQLEPAARHLSERAGHRRRPRRLLHAEAQHDARGAAGRRDRRPARRLARSVPRARVARPEVRHVLTFENKGEVVGVSNPHPHGQIYATNFVFKTIETEAAASRRYYPGARPRALSRHHPRRAGRRPPDSVRERVGDCLSSVLRALRVRVLRRAERRRTPASRR